MEKIRETRKEKKKKIIIKVLIAIIVTIILFLIAYKANDYIILGKNKTTNLVINNKNVTLNLRKDIIIENDDIYISKQDLGNFLTNIYMKTKKTTK